MNIVVMSVIVQSVVVVSMSEDAAADLFTDTTIQVVDNSAGMVGIYTSIELDDDMHPHISYCDHSHQSLKYARWDGASWNTEVVDDANASDGVNSLDLDSEGNPHISYYDIANRNLNYARWTGRSWECQCIDSSDEDGFTGIDSSLRLDDNDLPHIVYINYTDMSFQDGWIKYARWTGASWETSIIENLSASGPSLDLDSAGHPHVCYYDRPSQDLRYAHWDGRTWRIETVDSWGNVGVYSSMGLDSEDSAHICYYDWDNEDLKYARRNGTTWDVETVDSGGNVGVNLNSIAVGPRDNPHISYCDWTNRDLKYATKAGGTWDLKTIDSAGQVGEFSSIAIESRVDYVVVHISYFDFTNANLKYARIAPTVPSMPRNLDLLPGDGFINVTWDTPLDDGGLPVSMYRIYKGEASGSTSLYTTVDPSVTFLNDTSVVNGRRYYYNITAMNLLGESASSLEVSGVPMAVPSPPRNLEGEAGDSWVLLTWEMSIDNGGAEIIRYNVYRAEDGATYTAIGSRSGTLTTYNDTQVVNGVEYSYHLTAVNPRGESQRSNVVIANPLGLPSAPSNINCTSGDGFANITWGMPTDDGGAEVEGFRVYRGTDSFEMTLITTTESCWYLDTGLENGVRYLYMLTTITKVGQSEGSPIVYAYPYGTPSQPLDFSLTSGDGFVLASWSPPTEDGGSVVVKYVIERLEGPGAIRTVFTVQGTVLGFNDTDVENGVLYTYSVLARSLIGDGEVTEALSARPIGMPDPPQGLRAEASDSRVTLRWETPTYDGGDGISGYVVERGTDHSGPARIATVPSDVLSFVDVNVTNGVEYEYTVIASNSVKESRPSDPVRIVPSTVPGGPMITGTEWGDGYILLEWSGPLSDGGSELVGFSIWREDDGGDPRWVQDVGPLSCVYNDTDVVNGVEYRYLITANNVNGPSEMSVFGTVVPMGPPFLPVDARADLDDGSVEVTWGEPANDGGSDVIGYRVYRRTGTEGEWVLVSDGPGLAFVDDDVRPDTEYVYGVAAYNVAGEGQVTQTGVQIPPADSESNVLIILTIASIAVIVGVATMFAWGRRTRRANVGGRAPWNDREVRP